ncbi:HAMP domain-containing histidine kinase [Sulfurimonas sp. SAG-AH-194-L11]|nr:HAMP domain-containing sensor histidine kinase [Sulfurimonas sp. SAG-AH-194-L11]MDF1877703.1 HAMP domain-containing histidine kinase [Sulfurimonas sp. SAG-AH-194-L11]
MNDLEKHSFYSFLAIYLVSSLFFVLLSSFWYYSSLKSSLENETYYKLTHLADSISGKIINAQMKEISLSLPNEEGYEYVLIPVDETLKYKVGYYEENGYKVLVSGSPQEHLNIAYVIVKTKEYFKDLAKLKADVATRAGLVFLAIFFISFVLAKLFMRPVHKRIEQIEEFIQDVSHELNTPITALKMSASRAIKKEVYDKKILTNISISTKQLETIYNSLTYLNFSDKQEESIELALGDVVNRVVKYYSELSEAKGVKIEVDIDQASLNIIESRAELLISNLLSNAIKYSMPESTIYITLQEGLFIIKDEGVGIAKDKLEAIFELYSRDSQIAGGFGVGLNIVKQICDTYKIKVQVTSTLGKGSEFKLLF